VDGCIGDSTERMTSGSLLLDMAISGTMVNGGLPNGQIIVFGGESSTGKTFFSVSIIDTFLKTYPNGIVMLFDSENAINTSRLTSRDIDISRINYFPVTSLIEFRQQCTKLLDEVNNDPKYDDFKFLFILDSLGNLPSSKELSDALEGSTKVDFTRTKEIRSCFRTIVVKLSKKKIPMIVTNHSYANIMEMYGPKQKLSGGGGITYAADYILMLSKAQYKETKDGPKVGSIISVTMMKNRDVKPDTKTKVLLSFKNGLHKYYGLVEYALEYKIWEKEKTKEGVAKKGGLILIDGKGYTEKQIYQGGSKFFTEDVIKRIDEKLAPVYAYGTDDEIPTDDIPDEVKGDDETEGVE
jgi:RecA/RadA recombinase